MKKRIRPQPTRSANVPIYRGTFIKRVFQLLKLGYDALSPARFAKAQEEVITGELVRAIDDVLDDPPTTISEWADSFWAQEERRIQQKGRRGRRRLRIDISIHSSQYHPRTRFHFEAKRLGGRHNAGAYLGPGGLGAYLCGAYASGEPHAGMLGYVQKRDEDFWAGEIAKELAASPDQHRCISNPALNQVNLVGGPQFTYWSAHTRMASLPEIRIYHSLFRFR